MKLANVREVKNQLSSYLNGLDRDDVIITKNGKPKAILYSFGEKDFNDYLFEQSIHFKKVISVRWKKFLKEGGVPLEEVYKTLR